MNNLCNRCGLCCRVIPVYNNFIIRDGFQPIEDFFIPLELKDAPAVDKNFVQKIQSVFPSARFCTCRYLSSQNECTNPNPPDICKAFPNSALALISDDCGYCGEIFIKNEFLKQKIRKLKEEIINYQAQIISDSKNKNNYLKLIKSHQNYINRYLPYGADTW